MTSNKAVLDLASRYRETFLYRIWRMGMNSIERGSKDSWTIHPKRVDWLRDELNAGAAETDFARNVGGFGGSRGTRSDYEKLFDPDLRDPRGYILPSDQPDFATATKFVNALLETGVVVERATEGFTVGSEDYPEGSYVVRAAQAFRPQVLDMFEPQDHPNDFQYPGAPPTPPYDNAGWTLAIQMGVEFDRILEGFDGPFEEITEWNATPAGGHVAGGDGATGFLFSHRINDSFTAVNRLLASGHDVYWLTEGGSAGGHAFESGAFYVRAGANTAGELPEVAAQLGVPFQGIAEDPGVAGLRLRTPRVGLWDTYGGSMPSGWLRMILEEFDYQDMELVFPQRLNAGNLIDDYDVIIFPHGALSSQFAEVLDGASPSGRREILRQFGGGPPAAESIPEEYRDRLGSVSPATTTPALQEFLEAGGSVVTIGGSTALGGGLGLPLENHLTRNGSPLPRGGVLRAGFDPGSERGQ